MQQKNYKLFLILIYLFCISCSDSELSYYDRKRYGSTIYDKKNEIVVDYDEYDDYDYKKSSYSKKNEIVVDEDYGNNKNIKNSNKTVKGSESYDSCTGGYYKIGNPYKVNGKTYYPKRYKKYIEYGLASWYGDDFHRNKTANDDVFNMNSMTGAHKTLPLPSIAKVTNVENGESQIIKINDRGPFVDGRIVDVSKAVATKLGFKNNGLTEVRVEYLPKETEKYLKKCGYDSSKY